MLTINVEGGDRLEVAVVDPREITGVSMEVRGSEGAILSIVTARGSLYFDNLDYEAAKRVLAMIEDIIRGRR